MEEPLSGLQGCGGGKELGPGLMLVPPLSPRHDRMDSAFCPLLKKCSFKDPVLASCISLGQFLICKMGTYTHLTGQWDN